MPCLADMNISLFIICKDLISPDSVPIFSLPFSSHSHSFFSLLLTFVVVLTSEEGTTKEVQKRPK